MENSLPYQSHSETSKAAAVKKTDAKADRKIILTMIIARGANGLTNDEISQRLGHDSSFYSPRLIELERSKKILKLKSTRKTRKERKANIYVAVGADLGREIVPVKRESKMPDPIIAEMDKRVLREFIDDIISSRIVYKHSSVYNAIKRLAGV